MSVAWRILCVVGITRSLKLSAQAAAFEQVSNINPYSIYMCSNALLWTRVCRTGITSNMTPAYIRGALHWEPLSSSVQLRVQDVVLHLLDIVSKYANETKASIPLG